MILALREAEELLALAKAQPGKDRCTLFGIPFRWDDLTLICQWAQRLATLVTTGALARGLRNSVKRAGPNSAPAGTRSMGRGTAAEVRRSIATSVFTSVYG